jgi:hypothetical protein
MASGIPLQKEHIMRDGRLALAVMLAAGLGMGILGWLGAGLRAQPREKPVEATAPAGPVDKYKIHEVRLANGEEYTLMIDTATGRSWVLGLSRDGSKLAWFDMGPLPLDNKPPERK